jgi:uncharacterized membrane protein YeiH
MIIKIALGMVAAMMLTGAQAQLDCNRYMTLQCFHRTGGGSVSDRLVGQTDVNECADKKWEFCNAAYPQCNNDCGYYDIPKHRSLR